MSRPRFQFRLSTIVVFTIAVVAQCAVAAWIVSELVPECEVPNWQDVPRINAGTEVIDPESHIEAVIELPTEPRSND